MSRIANDPACKIRGFIGSVGAGVYVDGHMLPIAPSLAVCNHSPTGFGWGYGGSGPAQLALAILLEATDDKMFALAAYQRFKWERVAPLPYAGDWEMTGEEVHRWIAELH